VIGYGYVVQRNINNEEIGEIEEIINESDKWNNHIYELVG